jgi:AcrR family transcriptional regulator
MRADSTPTTRVGKRIGSESSKTRAVIVASTEAIMLEEGYAAVTYRSVAARAEVTAGLVQYYFPTLDDLFSAVLRRLTDRIVDDLQVAFQTDHPMRTVWQYASNASGAALLVEFMALANHRKRVWEEIGEGGERVRRAQLEALGDRWDGYGAAVRDLPPAAVLFMLTAIGRMARLEEAFGTRTGHDEAIAIVERFLDEVEPRPSSARRQRRRPKPSS